MGSKVFANKHAVATTTSGHIASNVDGVYDARDEDGTTVERLSFVHSTELKLNRSAITQFDGGWVWRQSSEAGPSSRSEADDGLVGVVSGATNGKVMLAVGGGSPNVYVEKERVGCHTHVTRQNMLGDVENSPGKILDADEFAKEQERYRARQARLAALAAAAAAEAARQEARDRIRDILQTQEEPAAPNAVVQQTPKPKGIDAVVILERGRVQGGGAPTDTAGPFLEVLRGSTVEVVVDGDAASTIVLPDGTEVDGPKASWRIPGTVDFTQRLVLGGLLATGGAGGFFLGVVVDALLPELDDFLAFGEQSITVSAKEGGTGQFSRFVRIVPDFSSELALNFKGIDFDEVPFLDKLLGFAKKGGGGFGFELVVFSGGLSGKAAWEAEENHRVVGKGSVTLSVKVLDGKVSYKINLFVLLPGGQIIVAAGELLSALDIELLELFVQFTIDFSIGFSGTLEWAQRFGEPTERGGQLSVKGGAGLTIQIGLDVLGDRVRGAAGVRFGIEVEVPIIPQGPNKFTGSGTLFLRLTVDLGIFEFEGGSEVALDLADFGL